jgi:hypothetical protein
MNVDTSNASRSAAIGVLGLLALSLAVTPGCGYGSVSPLAYDYAKALYSISNRQAADQLEGVQQQIATAHQNGELSEQEAEWLIAILQDAQAAEWKAASRAARRMLEDQVRAP